jgi:hypothetical protein
MLGFSLDFSLQSPHKRFRRHKPERPKKRTKQLMTVCIATICHSGKDIIGLYDTMVTYGDIQYEAPQQKAIPICKSVLVLVAGDGDLQAEIINHLKLTVATHEVALPDDPLTTKQVADFYHDSYTAIWQQKVEKTILSKHRLTWETYLSRQREWSETFRDSLTREVSGFELPDIQAIIAGVDGAKKSAHLYLFDWNPKIRDYDVVCRDSQGFVCIGSGGNLADAALIAYGYKTSSSFIDAFFLCHIAKRRAEYAPGVGKKTRVLHIVDEAASFLFKAPNAEYFHTLVNQHYETMINEQKASGAKARLALGEEVYKTLERIKEEIRPQAEAEEQRQIAGTSATNEEVVRDGTSEGEPKESENE